MSEIYNDVGYVFSQEELRERFSKCVNITFADLENNGKEFREKHFTFYLGSSTSASRLFNTKLERLSHQITNLLNIGDFLIRYHESNFVWAEFSNERLATTNLSDLELAHPHQLRFINQRLNLIEEIYEKPERGDEYLCIQDIRQLNLEHNPNLHELPGAAFALFTDEQLQALNLDELSAEQVEYIFYRNYPYFRIDAEGCTETFRLLDTIDNNVRKNHNKFPAHLLQYNTNSSGKRPR